MVVVVGVEVVAAALEAVVEVVSAWTISIFLIGQRGGETNDA